MKFGGWAALGGGCQLGGGRPAAQIYYHTLKRLGPPGLRPDDDGARSNVLLRGLAVGCGHGQIAADRLKAELFPLSAVELLAEWEALLGVVPPEGATLGDRQLAAHARWRGLEGPSLPALRRALYPLLQPTWARDDTFPGAAGDRPSYVYTISGNGTVLCTGDPSVEIATLAADCRLDGINDGGALLLYKLNDIADDWSYWAKIEQSTIAIGANTSGGVIAWRDVANWVALEINGAGDVQITIASEGVLTEDYGGLATAIPGSDFYLQIARIKQDAALEYRESGYLVFSYGTDVSALTPLAAVENPLTGHPRRVGLFCRNKDPSYSIASFVTLQHRLTHATPDSNVEIIESSKAARDSVSGGGAEADVFFAYVHRDPAQSGSYQIKNAQRLATALKHAHKLILVGESDYGLYDDPYTLYDRDIYGR